MMDNYIELCEKYKDNPELLDTIQELNKPCKVRGECLLVIANILLARKVSRGWSITEADFAEYKKFMSAGTDTNRFIGKGELHGNAKKRRKMKQNITRNFVDLWIRRDEIALTRTKVILAETDGKSLYFDKNASVDTWDLDTAVLFAFAMNMNAPTMTKYLDACGRYIGPCCGFPVAHLWQFCFEKGITDIRRVLHLMSEHLQPDELPKWYFEGVRQRGGNEFPHIDP